MKRNILFFLIFVGVNMSFITSCINTSHKEKLEKEKLEKEKLYSEYKILKDEISKLALLDNELISSIIKVEIKNMRKITFPDETNIKFRIRNNSKMGMKGVKGIINILNQFGDNICEFNVEINDRIPTKGYSDISFTENNNLVKYKQSHLICTWTTNSIIFDNDEHLFNPKINFGASYSITPVLNDYYIEGMTVETIKEYVDETLLVNRKLKSKLKMYYNYEE